VSETQESLEWRSVTEAVQHIGVHTTLPVLGKRGIVAYTDGACIKNPGGPTGWAALLWAAGDFIGGKVADYQTSCRHVFMHQLARQLLQEVYCR
jgi:hypothetical protein